MVLDLSSYLQPGTYVDTVGVPTLAPAGIVPSTVCLVGRGVGYHTGSERVSFAGGTSVELAQKGINPASIVVSGYVTDPNVAGQSVPYTFEVDDPGPPIVPKDYSVATDTTDGATASVTTITKSAETKIESGYPQVLVTYQYTDADYYKLNYFEDLATVRDTYGPALDRSTGALISPLTFAAQVAFQNGVSRLYAVAVDPAEGTTPEQFSGAYQLISGANPSANLIVPLWDDQTVGTALAGMLSTLHAFLEADANLGLLRMALVGFATGYAGTPADVAALATGISSKRIVAAWPNKLSYYNAVQNMTVEVAGLYLAAAYAGILAGQDVEVPLTHKFIRGFAGLPADVQKILTTTAKNTLGSSGVSVADTDRAERLRVRHGLTTDAAGGILTREISLVRSQDALYNLLHDTMENSGLIGTAIGPDSALHVQSITAGALESAVTDGIILAYHSLQVREQSPPSGDPTVIEVKFAYRPSWPLNYIVVSFTVDTTTGNVTDLTETVG